MGCEKDAKPHLGCDGHHQDDMIFKALGSQPKPLLPERVSHPNSYARRLICWGENVNPLTQPKNEGDSFKETLNDQFRVKFWEETWYTYTLKWCYANVLLKAWNDSNWIGVNQIVRNFPWTTVFPFSKKPTAKGFVHLGSYETSGPMLTRKQNECPTLLTEQSGKVANSQSISTLKTYNFLENIPKKIRIQPNKQWLSLSLPPSSGKKSPPNVDVAAQLHAEETALNTSNFYEASFVFQKRFLFMWLLHVFKGFSWNLRHEHISIHHYLILFGLAILAI